MDKVPYVVVVHGAFTTMISVVVLGFIEIPVVSETFCLLGIATVFVALVNATVIFPAVMCACAEARKHLLSRCFVAH